MTPPSIATEAVRLVGGADGQLGELEQRLGLASIHHAQGGRLADLSEVKEAVYGHAALTQNDSTREQN